MDLVKAVKLVKLVDLVKSLELVKPGVLGKMGSPGLSSLLHPRIAHVRSHNF